MPFVNTTSFVSMHPGAISRKSNKITNRIFGSVIYDSNIPFSAASVATIFSVFYEHCFGDFSGFLFVEEHLD